MSVTIPHHRREPPFSAYEPGAVVQHTPTAVRQRRCAPGRGRFGPRPGPPVLPRLVRFRALRLPADAAPHAAEAHPAAGAVAHALAGHGPVVVAVERLDLGALRGTHGVQG